MPNYSPALPLKINSRDGIENLQDLKSVVLQNLKMVILTVPGERIMDPTFGVGIRNYIFEQNDVVTYASIKAAINKQVTKYLPYIDIISIDFKDEADSESIKENMVHITIMFHIRPLGINETLELNV